MKSARNLARIVCATLIALALLRIVDMVLTYFRMQSLHERPHGVWPSTQGSWDDVLDAPSRLVSMVLLALSIVCYIAFLAWFYRIHRNVAESGYKKMTYTSGWAIGSFLIPFFNLILPYLVMKEAWEGTRFLAKLPQSQTPRNPVWDWWGLTLLQFSLGLISLVLLSRATNFGEAERAFSFGFFSKLFGIPATIVALSLVRLITGLQDDMLAERTYTEPTTK